MKTIAVPDELHGRLKRAALDGGVTVMSLVVDLLQSGLDAAGARSPRYRAEPEADDRSHEEHRAALAKVESKPVGGFTARTEVDPVVKK